MPDTGPVSAIIDMRSDLLSPPSPVVSEAMQAALATAPEFELRGGNYESALERKTAALLGKEDALFFPTCTMANLCAAVLAGRSGGLLLVPEGCHVLTSEEGGASLLAGLTPVVLRDGTADPMIWAEALAPGDVSRPVPALVWLENTHNRQGGLPLPADRTLAIVEMARDRGVRSHLDGARLFNAAVALRLRPDEIAAGFDTVSISLNKGLGAPVGAMLAGSRALIGRAVAVRQRLGGGMRPSATLCAPALAVLDDWPAIARDHALARLLWREIGGGPEIAEPLTNVVMIRLAAEGAAEMLRGQLAANGVLALCLEPQVLRLVTHRGLTEAGIRRAAALIRSILNSFRETETRQ
ncbi:Low-specificity L-threonine aldolase [Hyphomicrobiales bacterium]|nr:Low-specificity L-threonine aldolase [Hyphomicrobiales bacterium]CAH1693766.1 Low-specificity L-threonine aldolase [Hyphomicrobiales bacterium]